MENLNNLTKSHTFADQFSKYKLRFLFIFWTLVISSFIYFSYPILHSIFLITKANDQFFRIEVKDDVAFYHNLNSMPDSWVPLNQISKRLQQAIISSEDGKFYEHPGYDLEQLRNAINDSFVLKKKMRGASTITQQLVKNVYLNKDRTFGRKVSELFLSIMIEKYTNKSKILEMYLNGIEYGRGLYGIKAASRFYFNKSPKHLNARESAFLAMLLPSPKKYSKSFKSRSLTSFANRMISSILLKMRQSGSIGEQEYLTQLNGTFTWEIVPIAKDSLESEDEFVDSNYGNFEQI